MKKSLIVLCIAFLSNSLVAQNVATTKNLYQDPNGFFSVFKPDGWKTSEYSETSRGKVKFIYPGNEKINVIIIGGPNPYSSFNDLVKSSKNSDDRMKEKYKAYDVTITSKIFTIENIQYTSSTITLKKMDKKLFMLDFIIKNTHFSFSYASTISSFDTHLPKIYDCIYSLIPSNRKFSDQEITNALVESKIKQAQFNIQMGLKDYASKYIEEGLAIDPSNKKLLELKNQINH
jgi:hypothetical protein